MSYLVLARKWRPMVFKDVVAQSHIATTLENAIKNDRLASAYLFSGPRGVGKTTTARIFAKAINCQDGPTPTPCNVCSSCQEINESRSLDVYEIDGASNRGIDEVRNLRENLRYAPSKGKHKIYIIDEVHMLTTEAFNALLKTLEEPPRRVLFIFATTEAHKVPATILSRCQRYDFRRIPLVEIVQQLQRICEAEGIKIDEDSLYLIAKKSDGSMRDSQSLLDQAVSFSGENVNMNDISELLGIIRQDLFFELTDSMAGKDISAGLQLVEKVFSAGHDLGDFLNGLTEHFRNLLVFKATGEMSLLEGLENYRAKYESTAKAFSETDLLRLMQMCSEVAYQIKRSPNAKIVLEMLVVKMIKMDNSVEIGELLSKLDHLKKKQIAPDSGHFGIEAQAPTNPSKKNTVTAIKQVGNYVRDVVAPALEQDTDTRAQVAPTLPTDAQASLEIVKSHWSEVIESLKKEKLHLGSFLREGYPTGFSNGTLNISFGKENGFHINTLNKNKNIIEKVILNQTGIKLRILCQKNDSEEFQQILLKHKPAMAVQNTEESDTLQIPMIKKVLEAFGGEIVQ